MKKDALIFLLCILSTTIFSQPNITAISAQDTICQGQSVALIAEGDIFDSYSWSPATWINNISTANPTVTPPMTTTYTVTGSLLGNNVIVNGDFSSGNSGFTTEYLFGPNTGGGPWGDLSDEGTYAVTTNPNNAHSNFASCTDNTNGFGNMLVVNGSATLNQEVWCQTINVEMNTNYEFSTWITSVENGNPAILQFSIDGTLLGEDFTAPAGTCTWDQFFEVWDSGNNTNVEICIVNQNTSIGGNDFALDDISFSPIQVVSSSVTISVSDISGVIATQSSTGCDGTFATASIAVNGGFEPYTYLWDNGETTEVAINLDEGNHTVTVTDAVGCAAIVNLFIESPQLPVIDEVVVEHTTCGIANGLLEVFPGAGMPPFQYSIDGTNFQSEAIFTGVSGGDFFVVIEDANGCTGAFQVMVDGSEEATAEIETPNGIDLCGELAVILDVDPNLNLASYLWSTGETTSSINPEEGGEYSVEITDVDGCTASAIVQLEDCGFWEMPNVFTPDGDGVNDSFGPVIQGNGTEILDFKIFNRWGNLVHDEKMPWDGEVEGTPHPSDVLVYFIRIETKDGVEEVKGDVSLIR